MSKKVAKISQKKNYRLTKQRLAILKYLKSVKIHPPADVIYREIKKKFPHISFGTVYRNLNFLQKYRYCQEFVLNKISRYDGRINSHVHLVCDKCQRIFDLDDHKIVPQLEKLAGRQNFRYHFGNFEIHGYCYECRKKMIAQGDTFCEACGESLHDLIKKEEIICKECLFKKGCKYVK